ncbi:Cys-tRNA(Pro) deacylase [Tomitella biformata]|uniref:Cys-tRNA(Pro) deacylase n=1 Tax=Tomitella biformata TaxID=630403 RepID=UPI000463D624|nr:Cys-tRNA(Pro) deacylase [Tomitella biformata]
MSKAPTTPATAACVKAGVAHTVHTYAHDPRVRSFGAEAVAQLADELGVAPAQIFKTLLVKTENGLAVAVLPVPSSLSLKAAAKALGARKAVMAEPADAERSTGYVVGGISPLGQRKRLPTVVDASALGWDRVLCSGGRRGLDLELAPADLIALCGATTAAITAM